MMLIARSAGAIKHQLNIKRDFCATIFLHFTFKR